MLDELIRTFHEDLAATRATEQQVPEEFARCGGTHADRYDLAHRLFVGDMIAYGRTTVLEAAERGQIVDILVAPRLATTLPILGVQIAATRGELDLAVFDLFQVATSDVNMRLKDELMAMRSSLTEGFELEQPPEWGDSIYSDAAVFILSGGRGGGSLSALVERFSKMLQTYLEAVRRFEPTMMRGLERRRRRREDYLDTQAERVPILDAIQRACGEEWSDRTAREFLFPDWLRTGDRIPPWLDEIAISS